MACKLMDGFACQYERLLKPPKMKIFKRTYLPRVIVYNHKEYYPNYQLTHVMRDGKLQVRRGKMIRVDVLSRNLKDKTNLHGQPYQPTTWVFSVNTLLIN